MRNVEHCGGCNKFTMIGIDNGSAILFAHQFCKCSKERDDAVSDEHLSGCSSLTTDGMLSKLDEMLWNHENSYLYEENAMSDNTRDTQFVGFADAICRKLAEKGILKWNDTWDDAKQIIARRAYDFANHIAIHACSLTLDGVPFYYSENDAVRGIPDMTELPKEYHHE